MIRHCTLFIHCLLFGAALPLSAQDALGQMEDGLAVVTTAKGGVTFALPGQAPREAELHAVETLSGMEIASGRGGHVFLSLSNGSAIGIYENSHVRIESYRQRPFPPEKESLEYEPSRSRLVLELKKGSLSFAAEHLSPLSEILVRLPTGTVEIHKASGRVFYDERGALITITSGIVNYAYPDHAEEDFINAPNRALISLESAKNGRMIEPAPESGSAQALTERLVNATHRAQERVIFKVPGESASIPRPILVARPEALRQPSPRPYTYLE